MAGEGKENKEMEPASSIPSADLRLTPITSSIAEPRINADQRLKAEHNTRNTGGLTLSTVQQLLDSRVEVTSLP